MTGSKWMTMDARVTWQGQSITSLIIKLKIDRATYGGGAKKRIVGKGTLNVDGLPELHNVLHVECLNFNL